MAQEFGARGPPPGGKRGAFASAPLSGLPLTEQEVGEALADRYAETRDGAPPRALCDAIAAARDCGNCNGCLESDGADDCGDRYADRGPACTPWTPFLCDVFFPSPEPTASPTAAPAEPPANATRLRA